ncbi:MAG TPA: hypothetical protein VKA85_08320 [Candidatus Limnocylindrales bacterium]|nr:hypothetical protein [Candidatus Limnocylindrales bacterium]
MTLGEAVDSAAAELEGVERRDAGGATEYLVRGRVVALVAEAVAEFALDPAVAAAALRTPDTGPSPRGDGWVAFAPPELDRIALDRATAWLGSACRRVPG